MQTTFTVNAHTDTYNNKKKKKKKGLVYFYYAFNKPQSIY